MKGKKFLVLVLAGMMLLGCLSVSTAAATPESEGDIVIMATSRFNTTLAANKTAYVGNGFSLAAGEVVTIKATYSPYNASIDFGLVAPNGLFYGLSGSNGSFDEGIQVSQNGVYQLAIRNCSSVSVSVSGHVTY